MRILTKRTLTAAFIIIASLSSGFATGKSNQSKKERFGYKLKLGWFTLGSGKVSIAEEDTVIDNHTMHKVKVYTETLGLGNWLSNLDDHYVSYIDSESLRSHSSYKDVTAGNSHWEQWNRFLYADSIIDIKAKDHRKEDPNRQWKVKLEEDVYDILGTFLYFKKAIDWRKVEKNDTVMIRTLYKHDLYRVGLRHQGIERIKFNGKNIKAHKLRLLMPDQEKLRDDRPVYIWLTADENQYPVRIHSKLFIGSARCELESINGKSPKL